MATTLYDDLFECQAGVVFAAARLRHGGIIQRNVGTGLWMVETPVSKSPDRDGL